MLFSTKKKKNLRVEKTIGVNLPVRDKQNPWDCIDMVWIGITCFIYFKVKTGD